MLQYVVILLSFTIPNPQTSQEAVNNPKTQQQPTTFAASGPAALAAAFSPDGKQLAIGHTGGTIIVYDVESQAPLATLSDHSRNITSLSFSPDGNVLASASSDKTVRLWDTLTNRQRFSQAYNRRVTVTACTPDGKSVLAATGPRGGIVQRIALDTERAFNVFDERTSVHAAYDAPGIRDLAVRPDGKVLAVGVFRGIVLVELEGNKELRLLPEDESIATRHCCYSNDGRWLASASRNITLWDADSGQVSKRLKSGGTVAAIRFSPDDSYFVAGIDGGEDFASEITIWKTGEEEPIALLDTGTPSLKDVGFTPDGKQLMTCHASGVKLWDFSAVLAGGNTAD